MEIVATAACWSIRLVRLPGLRNRLFWNWKNVQIAPTIRMTSSAPASP